MIPTLIVFGLVFGRRPWRCLAVAVVAWPLLLVATGILGLERSLAGAAGLAILNSLVGVAIHQGLTWAIRRRGRAGHAPVVRSADLP